ncbi:hypothetical protein AAHE18_03G380200 [Arachis hypogaea]
MLLNDTQHGLIGSPSLFGLGLIHAFLSGSEDTLFQEAPALALSRQGLGQRVTLLLLLLGHFLISFSHGNFILLLFFLSLFSPSFSDIRLLPFQLEAQPSSSSLASLSPHLQQWQ